MTDYKSVLSNPNRFSEDAVEIAMEIKQAVNRGRKNEAANLRQELSRVID